MRLLYLLLFMLRLKNDKSAIAVIAESVLVVESARVHPHPSSTRCIPSVLNGGGKQRSTEALTDEFGQESEGCDSDISVVLRFQLEVTHRLAMQLTDPCPKSITMNVATPSIFRPREAVSPFPLPSNVAIEFAI